MPGIREGRIIYAIAMVGWGVLGLVYFDFINSLQPVPASLPGYGFLAVLNGIFFLVAGLAIMAERKLLPAAVALAVMFTLWIVVLHVPAAFIEPAQLRSPFWIRVFESLALGGAAVILAGLANTPVREDWIRTGRILFGLSLPVFGVLHFIYPQSVAMLIAWYPWPMFWAWFTGAAHFAAGVAIATGVLARPAALLAGVMYGLWALTLHLPRQFMEDPVGYKDLRSDLTSLFVAVAFCGAAWIVAGSLVKGRAGRGAEVSESVRDRRKEIGNGGRI